MRSGTLHVGPPDRSRSPLKLTSLLHLEIPPWMSDRDRKSFNVGQTRSETLGLIFGQTSVTQKVGKQTPISSIEVETILG